MKVVSPLHLLIGVLFLGVFAPKSAQGIRCHSCVYQKFGPTEIGNSSCKKAGVGHTSEECNEDTVLPVSKLDPSSPPITLADMRRESSNPLGKKTVYGCALLEIKAEIHGKPFYMMTRSCAVDTDARAECKTGSKKDMEDDPDFPKEMTSHLDDNASMRVCSCYKDECQPETSSAPNIHHIRRATAYTASGLSAFAIMAVYTLLQI